MENVKFTELTLAAQAAIREIVALHEEKVRFNLERMQYPSQIDYVALLKAVRDSREYLQRIVGSFLGLTWLLHDKSKLTGKYIYQMAIEGFYTDYIPPKHRQEGQHDF